MLVNEWKLINESTNANLSFFQYWTQKEAVIKTHGKGLGTLEITRLLKYSLILAGWRCLIEMLLEIIGMDIKENMLVIANNITVWHWHSKRIVVYAFFLTKITFFCAYLTQNHFQKFILKNVYSYLQYTNC